MSNVTRPLRISLIAALLLQASGSLLADTVAPPSGKYRCYQPPGYTVMAWFELHEGMVSVNGGDAEPYTYHPGTRRIDWPFGAFAPLHHGRFFAHGELGDETDRTTIVLLRRPETRIGKDGWGKLPRCYLTQH